MPAGIYRNNNNWTKEELKIMEDYSNITKQGLLELLPNRKYQSIINKACKLGLKKSKEVIKKQTSSNVKGRKWNKESKMKQSEIHFGIKYSNRKSWCKKK